MKEKFAKDLKPGEKVTEFFAGVGLKLSPVIVTVAPDAVAAGAGTVSVIPVTWVGRSVATALGEISTGAAVSAGGTALDVARPGVQAARNAKASPASQMIFIFECKSLFSRSGIEV